MEAGAAYDTYLLRKKTEENFRLDKQYNDAVRTRSKGMSALDGRFFCQFVVMEYEQFLYEQISRLKSELAVKTGEPGHDSAEMFKAEKTSELA